MKKRVISAILMIMLFIPVVILGGYPFLIVCSILAVLGLKELLDLKKNVPNIVKYSSYLLLLFFIIFNYSKDVIYLSFNIDYLIVLLLFYFTSIVIIGDLKKYNYTDALFLIMAIVLMGVVFRGMVIVRNISIYEIVYLFLISSLTDTFALFVGKYFGKHKLSIISPKKTIEGSIGGSLFGSLFASLLYWMLIGYTSNFFIVFAISLCLSVLGQIGDLFFSSIKRSYGIKDFGDLIPGHGGILDRLDSVCFVLLGYIIILM